MHDVALCMAVLNEGPQLEATIATAVGCRGGISQVVIVDDCSVRPCGNRVRAWAESPDLTMIYHENTTNDGCGAARTKAVGLATAGIIAVADPHVRFPWEWAEKVTAAIEAHPDDVFCAVCTGFEDDQRFKGFGAKIVVSEKTRFIEGKWLIAKPDGDYPVVPCVYGGAYFARASTFREMGGFAPLLIGWGLDEEWIAVRAAMQGRKCRLIANLTIPHLFKVGPNRDVRVGSRKDEAWTLPYNRAVIAKAAFGEPERWVSRLMLNPAANRAMEIAGTEIERTRAYLASVRRQTDEAIYNQLGLSPGDVP